MKRGTKKKLDELLMQQTNTDLRRIASTVNVMIRVRRMKLVVPDAMEEINNY
jgi:hypothetical protein